MCLCVYVAAASLPVWWTEGWTEGLTHVLVQESSAGVHTVEQREGEQSGALRVAQDESGR